MGPYLIGTWQEIAQEQAAVVTTEFMVTNPTVYSMDVYGAYYDRSGALVRCTIKTLSPMASWVVDTTDLVDEGTGAVAFVTALPGKKTPSDMLLISGVQTRWIYQMSASVNYLMAAVLNTGTRNEITRILANPACVAERPNPQ
jgi:hypothetical protein